MSVSYPSHLLSRTKSVTREVGQGEAIRPKKWRSGERNSQRRRKGSTAAAFPCRDVFIFLCRNLQTVKASQTRGGRGHCHRHLCRLRARNILKHFAWVRKPTGGFQRNGARKNVRFRSKRVLHADPSESNRPSADPSEFNRKENANHFFLPGTEWTARNLVGIDSSHRGGGHGPKRTTCSLEQRESQNKNKSERAAGVFSSMSGQESSAISTVVRRKRRRLFIVRPVVANLSLQARSGPGFREDFRPRVVVGGVNGGK